MRVLLSRERDDEGAIAVVAVGLALLVLVLSAFVIDLGMAYNTKRQLSTAADAASLAAAGVYKAGFAGSCSEAALASQAELRNDAETEADRIFRANYADGSADDGSIIDVRCKGTAVEVVYQASGESDSPFGPLAGGDPTISSSAEAAATYDTSSGACALCFLGSIDAGNADFTVTGGDIHVNGDISSRPNAHWSADSRISVTGTVSGGVFDPAHTQGPVIPDPFASMPLPLSESGLEVKNRGGRNGKEANPCEDGPGIYPDDVEVPNSACQLAPGAYVIKGRWSAKNNTVLSGANVTLYVKASGQIDFKNADVRRLSAPVATAPPGAPAGWPSGFVIIYDRDNINSLSIQGNGDISLDGNIYLPAGNIDFNGNSCLGVNGGAIVARGVVKANGNKACVNVSNSPNVGEGFPGNLRLTE